jgi:hypothetical protein
VHLIQVHLIREPPKRRQCPYLHLKRVHSIQVHSNQVHAKRQLILPFQARLFRVHLIQLHLKQMHSLRLCTAGRESAKP